MKATAAPIAYHASLDITIDVAENLRLHIDQGDLAEMLSNLIDNACKWARQRVVVAIDATAAEVRDDGPGIAPDQRAAALTIGGRLDPRVPDSGLGLAAVADLSRIYGGELQLDRAPEGGLNARIVLRV